MLSAADKKKNRDRLSQARKRQREKDLITSLQKQVFELQKRLGEEPVAEYAPSPTPSSTTSYAQPTVRPTITNSTGRPSSTLDVHSLLNPSLLSNKPYDNGNSAEATGGLRTPGLTYGLDNNLFSSRPPEPQSDVELQQYASPGYASVYGSNVTSPRGPQENEDMLSISSTDLQALLAKPEWLRLPMWSPCLASDMSDLTRMLSAAPDDLAGEIGASPEDLTALPLEPKIIDLLFGDSSNKLANSIATKSRYTLIQTPERVAVLWNLYVYMHVSERLPASVTEHFWTNKAFSGCSLRLLKLLPEYLIICDPLPCNSRLHIPVSLT